MNVWQARDFIISIDGASGSFDPLIVPYSMPGGAERDWIHLAPPLDAFNTPGLLQLAMNPNNSRLYGTLEFGANPTGFYYLDADGILTFDRANNNFLLGQSFDNAGNRYIADWNSFDGYHIRKITLESDETIFPFDDTGNDPNIETVATEMNRLRVAKDGSIAYWNSQPKSAFLTSTFNGFNRIDLTTGQTLPYFDLQESGFPSATSLIDFDIGPVTGYAYIISQMFGRNWLFKVDTPNVLNSWPLGTASGTSSIMAINCDETILAVGEDNLGELVNFFDLANEDFTNPLFTIQPLPRNDCIVEVHFARCPAVAGRFMPFVTLVGAT